MFLHLFSIRIKVFTQDSYSDYIHTPLKTCSRAAIFDGIERRESKKMLQIKECVMKLLQRSAINRQTLIIRIYSL